MLRIVSGLGCVVSRRGVGANLVNLTHNLLVMPQQRVLLGLPALAHRGEDGGHLGIGPCPDKRLVPLEAAHDGGRSGAILVGDGIRQQGEKGSESVLARVRIKAHCAQHLVQFHHAASEVIHVSCGMNATLALGRGHRLGTVDLKIGWMPTNRAAQP